MTAAESLDTTFAALADPTRRAIVQRLAAGELTVNEIAAPLQMTLPGVSKHLKVLEHAGLILRRREAQRRPCRLNPEKIKEAAEWMEQYRRFWEQSLDRLEDYLQEMQSKEHPDDPA